MNPLLACMNRMTRTAGALVVAAAAMAALAGAALAQAAEPVVLRYSTSSPEKSAFGAQIARLAQAVSEETGGSVRLDIYYASQLAADREAVQQVARGRIDATGANITNWSALVPELQLLMLPMYFRSAAEMDCTLDGPLTDDVTRRLQARGVRMLRWADGSTFEMFGKKAFTSPADLAGLKGGAYGSRLGVLMWQALDARPTPTSTPELATAFQTGLLDVTVTPPIYYVALGLNKIAPVMTLLDLYFASSVTAISQASWDKLTPAQREGVMRAMNRTPIAQVRAETRAAQQRAFDQHVAAGGQLVVATPEQRAAFRKVFEPVWLQTARESGPEGPAFFEAMEAARKACTAPS
jgi:TRAP-type C4-dicarboxylate transport system substrate-binding protein